MNRATCIGDNGRMLALIEVNCRILATKNVN